MRSRYADLLITFIIYISGILPLPPPPRPVKICGGRGLSAYLHICAPPPTPSFPAPPYSLSLFPSLIALSFPHERGPIFFAITLTFTPPAPQRARTVKYRKHLPPLARQHSLFCAQTPPQDITL